MSKQAWGINLGNVAKQPLQHTGKEVLYYQTLLLSIVPFFFKAPTREQRKFKSQMPYLCIKLFEITHLDYRNIHYLACLFGFALVGF